MTNAPTDEDKNSKKYVLTEEEAKILERMKKEWEEVQKIPKEKRIPVPNSDKYDAPIGFDDEGKPFPVDEIKEE